MNISKNLIKFFIFHKIPWESQVDQYISSWRKLCGIFKILCLKERRKKNLHTYIQENRRKCNMQFLLFIFINLFKRKLTTARLSKVKSYQLNHVRLKKIDVPPWPKFFSRQRASLRCINLSAATVHRTLRNTTFSTARLHWCLSTSNV